MKYFIDAIKKYGKSEGRTSRKAYWMFYLFSFLFAFGAGFIDGFFGLGTEEYGVLGTIYNLFILVPTITAGVRRMHDVGKNGWYLLIPIYNIVLLATKGSPEKNKYGEPIAAAFVAEETLAQL